MYEGDSTVVSKIRSKHPQLFIYYHPVTYSNLYGWAVATFRAVIQVATCYKMPVLSSTGVFEKPS